LKKAKSAASASAETASPKTDGAGARPSDDNVPTSWVEAHVLKDKRFRPGVLCNHKPHNSGVFLAYVNKGKPDPNRAGESYGSLPKRKP
jgi:hypothetical protein